MNAREQARMVAKEMEFLEIAAPYQDELDEAKDEVRAARESGDAQELDAAAARLDAAKDAINTFRHWARSNGKPRHPGPGSAVIKMGG